MRAVDTVTIPDEDNPTLTVVVGVVEDHIRIIQQIDFVSLTREQALRLRDALSEILE